MAICGLLLVAGCHKDSDNEADGYTVTVEWKDTEDIYTGSISSIENGQAYFYLEENDILKLTDQAYYFMACAGKWFYAAEWPNKLQVGSIIKFQVERVEYFKSTKYVQIPEPEDVRFYIKRIIE